MGMRIWARGDEAEMARLRRREIWRRAAEEAAAREGREWWRYAEAYTRVAARSGREGRVEGGVGGWRQLVGVGGLR